MDVQDKTSTSVVTPSDHTIDQCVEILQRGGVIAVPTDTIYGFAVSATNSEAIERLYSLKGRDKTKPIAVCVGGPSDVNRSKWDACMVAVLVIDSTGARFLYNHTLNYGHLFNMATLQDYVI